MTRGLMGNWTFDIDDDFTLPSGREQAVFQTDDIKGLHNEFGMKCKSLILNVSHYYKTHKNKFIICNYTFFKCSNIFYISKGVLHDKEEEGIGKSLFTHANGQSSNTYYDEHWQPEWDILPEIPDNV